MCVCVCVSLPRVHGRVCVCRERAHADSTHAYTSEARPLKAKARERCVSQHPCLSRVRAVRLTESLPVRGSSSIGHRRIGPPSVGFGSPCVSLRVCLSLWLSGSFCLSRVCGQLFSPLSFLWFNELALQSHLKVFSMFPLEFSVLNRRHGISPHSRQA